MIFPSIANEGAYFVETRVNISLDEFLNKPDLLSLNKFLPCEFNFKESMAGTYVSNFQENIFNCDGLAIGICISHRIMDGAALSSFVKCWSGIAQGCIEPINPNFNAACIFPTDDLWLKDSSNTMWRSMLRKGNCITKIFVFDSFAISKLKAEAIRSGLKCPTRAEVVSGFLWTSAVAASSQLHGFRRPSLLTHLVNLRKRMELASLVSENSVGHFLWVAAAKYNDDQSEPKFGDLVGKVRESISRIDEFIKKIKGEEQKSVMLKSLEETVEMGSADSFGFSSWCNFGYCDADFGWGKPVWVSSIGLEGSAFMNMIILVDAKFGDGIEAWITLDARGMAILEANPDFIGLVSLDPSLLVFGGNHPIYSLLALA